MCDSSIFSMIGFGGGTYGIVGAFCGILACVASSIVMCCAPKSTEEGGCKFTAVRDGSMHNTATPHKRAIARRPTLLAATM